MLLDLAGIDRNERIMVQASIGNSRNFEKIADALVLQHPRIHMRGNRTPTTPRRFVKGKARRKAKAASEKAADEAKVERGKDTRDPRIWQTVIMMMPTGISMIMTGQLG